jgi:hypothetical protein
VFQPAPPSAVKISGTTTVTAVVSDDPSNAGVDWSLSCQPATNCGSFSSPHTASGQAVTYISPPAISTNNQVVNILAFATADHTTNVATKLTVTAFASFLQSGTYVIETSGSDVSGAPYQRAGAIVIDGNGGVTGGEQTVNFVNPNTTSFSSVTDGVTGGGYFVGADGRGTLTINTNDPDIGTGGVESFNLVVLSNSRALVTSNGSLSVSGELAVGTLDFQSPQAGTTALAKGYAFVANGTDLGGTSTAIGGVFNVDSPRAISGFGSAFDEVSAINFGPGYVQPSSFVSGTVSTDPSGVIQITLSTDFGDVHLNAYPVGDGTHLKIIESDNAIALTVGDAYSQGSATGSFKTKSTFTGNYAFGIFGRDLGGLNASLAAAGLFSTAGTGTLTSGYIDESQAADVVQISDGFHAVYAVGKGIDTTLTTDPEGTGRFYIPISNTTGNPNFTFSHGSNGTGPALVFYLTGNGGPALVLDADVEPALASGLYGAGTGTGVAYPVTTGASFSGSYGTIFTQNMLGVLEDDVVGEIAASGNALSGVLDSSSGQQVDDTSLSGSYHNSAISGRLTGTITDPFFVDAQGNTGASLSMAFYPIDSTQGFFVENDLADNFGTPISGDLIFGYYTTRTPVCQGCP